MTNYPARAEKKRHFRTWFYSTKHTQLLFCNSHAITVHPWWNGKCKPRILSSSSSVPANTEEIETRRSPRALKYRRHFLPPWLLLRFPSCSLQLSLKASDKKKKEKKKFALQKLSILIPHSDRGIVIFWTVTCKTLLQSHEECLSVSYLCFTSSLEYRLKRSFNHCTLSALKDLFDTCFGGTSHSIWE